jgi:serine/threonine protein kinase/WD40 repeat protein
MSDSSSGVNPFDALAEEFVARHRAGENPSVSEYAAKHPELAGDIRDLFPGLLLMEGMRPAAEEPTRPVLAVPAKTTLQQLGEYRILREIGRGGMGVVYEAEQVSLGRHVALKVLPGHGLMNPTFLERFRREAKAAARLHHTNIVPVFGVGEAEGVHFYAMQFIQGQSLDQVLEDVRRLRKPPLTPTPLPQGERGTKRTPLPRQERGTNVAPLPRQEKGTKTAPLPRQERGTKTARLPLGERGRGEGDGDDGTGVVLQGIAAQGLLTGQFQVVGTELVEGPDATPGTRPPAAPIEPRSSTGLSAGGSEAQYYRSVARVGLQVADALAYAHRQGVLHRDVKPSNLLLDQQGTVWITDFGLAKAEGADDLTGTGELVGTMRFMAPERFGGRSLPQSDIYSLGLTLYELLTLRPAFDDTDKMRLIEGVLHEPPVPPRKRDPHIPRDLETIVLTCLAKDPAGRYATAEALAEDLRRFLADRPIRARRASLAERLWRWCRRNPVVATLLAAVGMLLIAVATVSTFSATRLEAELTQRKAAERQARLREADALVGQAHGIRYSRRSGQRFEALAALDKAAAIGRELGQPPEWFDRLRNEAIAALALPDVHITSSWDGFPPGTHRAELSTDFELYARTTKQGACSIRSVADDVEIGQLPPMGEPMGLLFGPGRLLLVRGETSGRCQLWDLSGRQPVLRLDEQRASDRRSFRRDARLIALGHLDGSISVYETASGNRQHFLAPNGITRDPHPDLHPTEPFVAICSYWSRLLQVRDLRSGVVLVSLTLPWRGSFMCIWSPDGRMLAVSEGDGGRVQLYDFDPATPGLRLTHTLQGSSTGGTLVRFNPAGDRLATVGWNSIVNLFDVSASKPLFSTKAISGGHPCFHFDLTGTRLGAARVGAREEQIGLWSVADAREYRALACDRATYAAWVPPAIHPGGRLAARGLKDGVGLWDLETDRQVGFLPVSGGGGCVCFDGAGNLFSNSFGGCFRWPVRPNQAQPNRFTIGPPERLPFPSAHDPIAVSLDGQVIAQATFGKGGWVLAPGCPQPRQREPNHRLTWTDVSPDGRFVAFGIHVDPVNVYEVATGRRVWQSAADGHCYARFSRDGRWLATENDGVRSYRVGTWEPGPRLGPGTPRDISPDSRLVVLVLTEGVYRIVELATGRELARLEDPEQIAGPAVFTPDGTCLLVGARDGLRIWDLRRIRAELTKVGLDWDAPPYPEAPETSPAPLEIRVVGAGLIGGNVKALNNQAWHLVTGPAEQRDPATALQLIQEAVKLQPENTTFLNTLGVVQYRNGKYAEAVVALEKSLAGKVAGEAHNLFFLTMCHAKLGNPAKAKYCFERAVKWLEAQKNLKPERAKELKAFRAEAEALLNGPQPVSEK